jgi:hypothetical protein
MLAHVHVDDDKCPSWKKPSLQMSKLTKFLCRKMSKFANDLLNVHINKFKRLPNVQDSIFKLGNEQVGYAILDVWHFGHLATWKFAKMDFTNGSFLTCSFVNLDICHIEHLPIRQFANLDFYQYGHLAT